MGCSKMRKSLLSYVRRTMQGRSMIEILGVLAVIGVLSVTAIAGFQYAMTKHYANESMM